MITVPSVAFTLSAISRAVIVNRAARMHTERSNG
jgi:hypothetical protein